MPPLLAARLRDETADLHRRAERSGVMYDLLRGRLELGEYVRLLRNLRVVYEALEEELARHAAHPVVAPFRDASLDRAPALADDLEALHGVAWRGELPVTDAAARYARRIRQADPHGLVAHAYVRYLGDLSGGQALRGVVIRGLGLDPQAPRGVRFYDFAGIADLEAYKGSFRASLDALALPPDAEDRLVAEAREAFALNVTLFEEVAPRTASAGAPPLPPVA